MGLKDTVVSVYSALCIFLLLLSEKACSSCFAARIQKKQPLFAQAQGKNVMHHKRVARKQVNHFLLVLGFNDHQ